LLPIINGRSIRRRLARLVSYLDISAALPARAKSILGTHILAQAGLTKGKRGRYWSLPSEQCAICAENASYEVDVLQSADTPTYSTATGASVSTSAASPQQGEEDHDDLDPEPPNFATYTPYITGCGHVYCYHCITERMMRAADEDPDGLGWECLRCNEPVRSADRVEGEIVQGDLSNSSTGEDGDDFELGELDTSEFPDSSLDDDQMSRDSNSD
jgi:peroxin-2